MSEDNYISETHRILDREIVQRQGHGFRSHLGASIIGRSCARQLWYTFRWATRNYFDARVLRLFQRGHAEEDVIVKNLRQSGVHVLEVDPETGKQFRIVDHDGHFGGSLDGKLYGTADFPDDWILAEFKTHNDKSFKKVTKQGVEKAKYEHFVQMQIYMHYEELPAALYFAVNKNDDDMFVPVVEYDPGVAERFIDRAGKIIYAPVPPKRLPNASVGWWECRFCDHNAVCLRGAPKLHNCRTCVHADPIEDGKWVCQKFQYELSKAEQMVGCKEHNPIPEE